jgi:AraC-like DNA-binding protein
LLYLRGAIRGPPAPGGNALDVPRLALIRRDILARLTQPELNLAQIARLHHLTPRQVQRLFAREGTCFSDYVRDARLDHVRAALADPRQRHRRVLQIVLDNGFDDFSAFSRAFKRRFGTTPTEIRGMSL